MILTPRAFDWLTSAACSGHGSYPFFGPDGETQYERESREAEAKRVCAVCPVRAAYLAHGVHSTHGVFGGLGEDERTRYRRSSQKRRLRSGGTA